MFGGGKNSGGIWLALVRPSFLAWLRPASGVFDDASLVPDRWLRVTTHTARKWNSTLCLKIYDLLCRWLPSLRSFSRSKSRIVVPFRSDELPDSSDQTGPAICFHRCHRRLSASQAKIIGRSIGFHRLASAEKPIIFQTLLLFHFKFCNYWTSWSRLHVIEPLWPNG